MCCGCGNTVGERGMKKDKTISLKKTLNLAAKEKSKGNDPKIILPAALILAVVIVLFGKFAVVDRLNAANGVYSEINYLNQRTEDLRKENEQYNNIKQQYEHYTYSAYSEDELELTDVNKLFTLIDSCLLPNSQIENFVFNSNVINVVINNVTLQDVSLIVSDLYKSNIVDSVTVSTAYTNNNQKMAQGQKVTATITINLKPADGSSGKNNTSSKNSTGSGGDKQ